MCQLKNEFILLNIRIIKGWIIYREICIAEPIIFQTLQWKQDFV